MQRLYIILSAVLVALIVAVAVAAFLVWRHQERVATVIAGVPAIPNLSRWPAEMNRQVQEASASAQGGKDPVAALGRLAIIYHANGFAAEAKQALDAVIKLEPKNARWFYLRADLRLRANDFAGAEQALLETVKLDPTYQTAWLRRGAEKLRAGGCRRAG